METARAVADTVYLAVGSGSGTVAAWAGAIATFFTGVVAVGIALYAGKRDRDREAARLTARRDAADARVAGLAFAVRRTLDRSLQQDWYADAPIHQTNRATRLERGFIEHERRIEAMLAEATEASPDVAARVRAAARLFWKAAAGVSGAAAKPLKQVGTTEHGRQILDFEPVAGDAWNAARQTTEDCVDILRKLDAAIRDADAD